MNQNARISSINEGAQAQTIALSRHASIRVQQRGVDPHVLYCLIAYGHHEPDHKGCQVVTFDAQSLDELTLCESRRISQRATEHKNVYAVVSSDGVIVTAGHRFRRIPRDLSQSALRPGRSRSPHSLHAPSNPFSH